MPPTAPSPSRSGLSPLDAAAAKARDAAYDADRQALKALIAELDAKQLRVIRFVRVACPARGTTLAAGRLDRWLSVLDFAAGGGLFGEALDFLLAVVKARTDPRTLPGVEAMMPGPRSIGACCSRPTSPSAPTCR
ncbi:MAG: hypothetical protein R3E34_13370 [Rhodocyclaceae bacterium]